jgi:hypothetical protein
LLFDHLCLLLRGSLKVIIGFEMHKILSALLILSALVAPSTVLSESEGLSKYQQAKLRAAIRRPANPGLGTVCNEIRIPNSQVLYKHPGSNHLPTHEQNTMTFIHSNAIQAPANGQVRGYDKFGNLVTILGRKYPNYVVGNQPRYYNIPTGDKKTAQQVARIVQDNTGAAFPVYLRVGNKICYKVKDLTFSRFGF